MKKKIVAVFLVLVMLLGLYSCNIRKKPREATLWDYFDTFSTILDYTRMPKGEFDNLVEEVDAALSYYHKLFDIYNEYDGVVNMATINARAGEGPIQVEPAMVDFLSYCKEMYYLTEGSVNIAAGSVLSIWHDYRTDANKNNTDDDNKLPTSEELLEAKNHIDIEKLIINEEAKTVELLDEKMSLDVGAIGKGYAVERVSEIIRAKGYTGIVLNVGGNLKIIGDNPNGEYFKTGIRSPYNENEVLYTFDVKDTACVTSGGYERYFTVDGKKYNHLIDMETLMPAEHFESVTIVTFDSGLADALSSAFFIMSFDEGKAFLETLDGVRVIWVDKNGKVIDSYDFDN